VTVRRYYDLDIAITDDQRRSPADADSRATLLVTKSTQLRRCWHPIAFASHIGDDPEQRRLLGGDLVVWRATDGSIRVAIDRCPHRWAKLSKGSVTDGRLICPYHGWQFDADGTAVEIPQLSTTDAIPPTACLDMVSTHEAFGMVWVILEQDEVRSMPVLPEFDDPAYRAIEVSVTRYETNAASIIDNNTDATHVAFVHAGSFGAGQDPMITPPRAARTAFGIEITAAELSVAESPDAKQEGSRQTNTEMWLPFLQISRMAYSDGTTHILVKGCCPIDDGLTDVHLTVLRNDLDNPADTDGVIAFERGVELEDKVVLDTIPAEFPLDVTLQTHVKHDRPGIEYRRALADLINPPGSGTDDSRPSA
jgi:phenylpropionate dioxygenase-like ring-hydroxylating dioxygenase large terminal subunit